MDLLIDPKVLPHHVTYAMLAALLLIAVSFIVKGAMKLVPGGAQNFIEVVGEAMFKLGEENMGRKWAERAFSLLGTLFMYILVCNFMGLIPGFSSPTANINMTASMAIPVFFITHIYGFSAHGIGYLKHFIGPVRSILALPLMALMFCIEFIGHLVRPLTLSVRLFGNMMAKHILLGVLAVLTPWVVPTAILMLGTLVGLIQAFVFTLLATLYLAGAVEEAH